MKLSGRESNPQFDRLYKYVNESDLPHVFDKGLLRIGTLYGYRQEEAHGNEIGDAGEGTVDIYGTPSFNSQDKKKIPEFTKNAVRFGPNQWVHFEGIQMSQKYQVANCYVFCVAVEALPAESMKRMVKDTCLRIKRPREFIEDLDAAIREHVPSVGELRCDKCTYDTRMYHYMKPISVDAAFLKLEKHSYQKEARFVWHATPIAGTHIDVSFPSQQHLGVARGL